MISTVDIIRRKRDGEEMSSQEIGHLINSYMDGSVPDYQMSAWLMAALLKGLTFAETLALTDALIGSGEQLDLTKLGAGVVDKHSTGGVGDKVTLVLGPVVSACGAVFGKMSGRSLGHTGGTVDKLESIPGLRTSLSPAEFVAQLKATGICVAGQSETLVPADRRLYALRDVTGTIESNALIAASVMSKKIAGGASAVAIDVKVGRGAFFKTRGHASGVAHLMEKIGAARGTRVKVLFTSMDQPLGHAVGNSLEVIEAVETLKGNGPPDVIEVVTALAALLLTLAAPACDKSTAEKKSRRSLEDGSALSKFREWITAQGGDTSFIEDAERLPLAEFTAEVPAPRSGFAAAIDALAVGRAVMELGAGRRLGTDAVDHGVGAVLHAKTGDRVSEGEALATVYARSAAEARAAAAAIAGAYGIEEKQATAPPVIIE